MKATLSWTAVTGATSYTVQFYYNNTWNNLNPTTGTALNVYGLFANTTYQWRVFATCGNTPGTPSNAVTFNTQSAPNCTGGVQFPAYALTPTTSWQYQSQMWGGEYCLVNVQAGQVYTFSYCSSDGGVLTFDGELSIRTTSNQLIMYSNDVCGTQPRLVWQAGFTGQVRVLLTRYSCSTQQNNSTMAYRIGGSPLHGDEPGENLAPIEERFVSMPSALENYTPQDASAAAPALSTGQEQPVDERKADAFAAGKPTELELFIAPNPASASTNLKIVAPESDDNGTEAYITIFDLNGSVRRTLQPMPVTNGIVQVTLELVDLPAGVYVVQVRLGQFIGRKQLVRMR